MVRRGDAANFPNGGFPLGRTPPNPANTPALFAMATRPIRQPPATKTDLPCVPRLIFLPSASSSLIFLLLLLLLLLVLLHHLLLFHRTTTVLCVSAPLPSRFVPFFFPSFLVSFAHTRLYVRNAKSGREESCRTSLFSPTPLWLCLPSVWLFPPLLARSSVRLCMVFGQEGERKRIEK